MKYFKNGFTMALYTIPQKNLQAHEEGSINQVHEQRQNRFFSSPLETFVRSILQVSPCRCLFLLRKFDQLVADPNSPNAFLETNDQNSRKIEDLKVGNS